ETASLELHPTAALVALDDRAFISFEFKTALLHLKTRAIGFVAADMQFASVVQQITIHRRITERTTTLAAQMSGFRFFVLIAVHHLVSRHQILGVFAALLRRQGVARTAEKYARGADADLHMTTTLVAGNISFGRLITAHAKLAALGFGQLIGEVGIEFIQE